MGKASVKQRLFFFLGIHLFHGVRRGINRGTFAL